MLRKADGSIARLEEVIREEKTSCGHGLMDLYLREGDTRRLVLREISDDKHGLRCDPETARALAAEGERIVTYGDFEKIAREFGIQLLRVWGEGDRHGRVFQFPKCDFHVNRESFDDPQQLRVLEAACELAGRNGSTYFVFDRDEVTLSACCRLRTTVQDTYPLRHPESMRFCGFQNVTINIPQAAYRAARRGKKSVEGLIEEIDGAMDIAVQAHVEKRESITRMLSRSGQPLWQVGKVSCDGRPYIELDKCTYIIGLIGLNDALHFLSGRELHEDEQVFRDGLRVVAHMNLRTKRLAEQHGFKFSLEETPAESAARRLAKTDMIYFPEEAKKTVKGSIKADSIYYTNSIHLAPEADVSLATRIRKQSMFHGIIESGAIIHAFVGEERPDAGAIFSLVSNTFHRTQCAQLTVSPEFTHCEDCHFTERGLVETCPRCGSTNVEGETRVVGYFSKIKNWNKSKRQGELPDRHRGNYRVSASQAVPA
jgi:ribonucleoside-triphosphate reductase